MTLQTDEAADQTLGNMDLHAAYGEAAHALPAPSAVAVAGTVAALATLVPVLLRQLRVIKHLPDPPGKCFDSNKIVMSKSARPAGVPDALLGLGSFAGTLALELVARDDPRARPLLAAKITVDTGIAALNATRQVVSFGKLCSWCTGTALAAFVTAAASGKLLGAAAQAAQPAVRRTRNTVMDAVEHRL